MFYKHHIKLAIKLAYSKQSESNHEDILHKARDNSNKEQSQANTESRSDEANEVMVNAYNQDSPIPSLPLPSQKFRIPLDSVPK